MIARLRSIIRLHRAASLGQVVALSAGLLATTLAVDGCVGRASTTNVAAAKVIYHCPMHPDYTSDKPGDCPICGMRLVPIEKKDQASTQDARAKGQPGGTPPSPTGHEGHVPALPASPAAAGPATRGGPPEALALGADRARLAGIRVVEAVDGRLARSVRAVGTVAIDETRVRQVTTKVGGFVERLYVNTTGQMVRAGQPLFDLYSPELLASQEEFLHARESAATFERSALPEVRKGGADLAGAARRRLELFDVPQEFIERLERTAKVERAVTFKAPFAGFVTGKNILAGQRIEPGMDLLTVSDLSRVWVIAQVYEAEAAVAQAGRRATVRLPYDSAAALSGRVDFVYPTVEAESRTLKVRLELSNARGALKPGMFVNVELDGPPEQGRLVPDTAVIDAGPRHVVFVETEPGRFASRDVVVGARQDGRALIRSGLAAGERVAVSANFLLDSESRLRGAVRSDPRSPKP
jgi:membrane fusion protein, copper/silver efflux system